MTTIWNVVFLNIFWLCSAYVVSYFLFGDFDTIFRFTGSLNIITFYLISSYIFVFLLQVFLIKAVKEQI